MGAEDAAGVSIGFHGWSFQRLHRIHRVALTLLIWALHVDVPAARKVQPQEKALDSVYRDRGIVKQKEARITDRANHGKVVSYLDARPAAPVGTVVFFHGMVYSARTWQVTGVMDALYDANYRAVAMDLPRSESDTFAEAFMAAVDPKVDTKQGQLVIVAASHGGVFALPFVWHHPHEVDGYVEIAASPDFLQRQPEGKQDVPVLMLYGDQDKQRLAMHPPMYSKRFEHVQSITFQDAPHACYLKDAAAAKTFSDYVVDFATGQARNGLTVVARRASATLSVADLKLEVVAQHPLLLAGIGGVALLLLCFCCMRGRGQSNNNIKRIAPTRVVGKAEADFWKDEDDEDDYDDEDPLMGNRRHGGDRELL